MWQALAAWCASRRPVPRLASLHPGLLAEYLAGRSGRLLADGQLTPRYQARLLALVRRVQAHHQWRRLQTDAARAPDAGAPPPLLPAMHRAPMLALASDTALPEPPLHLLPDDAQRLVQWLCRCGPAWAEARWQTTRDRCAVALQLGGGLGPGELRALRLADLVAPLGRAPAQAWQLRLAASGSAPAHIALLAPWAGELLVFWLAQRQAQALGGDWLLPSTRSGKPWGKVAQYEAARRVLADAGLDADGGGSFRLRHSFALRQLAHGHSDDQVARWLGVVDPAVMQRYRQTLGQAACAAAVTAAAAVGVAGRWPLPV